MSGLFPSLPDTIALTCLAYVPYCFYTKLELVSRSWKAVFRSVELFKERQVVGLYEDLLAVCCRGKNNNIWQLYDPVHEFWITLPEVPSKPRHLVYFRVVSTFQKIFVIGGSNANSVDRHTTNEVWSFDLITRTWSRLAPMLVSRASFACCIVEGKIVVAGGCTTSHSNLTSKAEMYDIEKDVWIPLPDLPRVSHRNSNGLMIGGKMHIGCDSFVQIFDNLEMKWRIEDYTWECGQRVVVRDSLYIIKWTQEKENIIIKHNGPDIQVIPSPEFIPGIARTMVIFRDELHIIGGVSEDMPKKLLSDVHILNVGDENPTWRYGKPMNPPCYRLVPTLADGTPMKNPRGYGFVLEGLEVRI